ncbi:MAG: hypothetical protein LC689_18630 [Myxococcales bacterium]|nr:hypothetical protein [Myxococcales bacterium]
MNPSDQDIIGAWAANGRKLELVFRPDGFFTETMDGIENRLCSSFIQAERQSSSIVADAREQRFFSPDKGLAVCQTRPSGRVVDTT